MRPGPLGAALCWPAGFFSPPLSPLSDLPFGALSAFAAGAPPAAAADASAFAGLAALSGFAALSSLGALPALGFFSSAIDLGSRTLGDPDLLAVRPELEADAGRLAVLGIGDRDVGQVDRQLLGDDAALLLCGLALVALDHVDAAHRRAAFRPAHLDHLATAALVAAGEHDDLVALLDLGSHHSTSGASEMIFMWFLARSSRGTGPKMRVPTGSIWGVMSTAALRSKRMIEPSTRRMSFLTRTTTAFITSPFLTRPRGIASFTETTITSPMVANLRFEPPSTLMHMTRRAPELSATSRLVCIWIMTPPWSCFPRWFPRVKMRSNDLLLLALGHFPPLELGQRPALLDPDDVAHVIFVGLVVGVELLRAPHRLLHDRMREAALHAHHHGLVLLVAHDDALECAL